MILLFYNALKSESLGSTVWQQLDDRTWCKVGEAWLSAGEATVDIVGCYAPVSYTHLDVYKRQP